MVFVCCVYFVVELIAQWVQSIIPLSLPSVCLTTPHVTISSRLYPFMLHTASNQILEVGTGISFTWLLDWVHTYAHTHACMCTNAVGSCHALVNMEVRAKVTPILNRMAWEWGYVLASYSCHSDAIVQVGYWTTTVLHVRNLCTLSALFVIVAACFVVVILHQLLWFKCLLLVLPVKLLSCSFFKWSIWQYFTPNMGLPSHKDNGIGRWQLA